MTPEHLDAKWQAMQRPSKVRPIESLENRPVAPRFRDVRELRFYAEPPANDEDLAKLLDPDGDAFYALPVGELQMKKRK